MSNFPPVHTFPTNPDLSAIIGRKAVTDINNEEVSETDRVGGNVLSTKPGYLQFCIGPGNVRNIIRLSSSPYIDYSNYSWKSSTWNTVEKDKNGGIPIVMKISGRQDSVTDITNYSRPDIIGFGASATSILDPSLSFYFDGEKLITNYDFSNPADRQLVSVSYWKVTDFVRVKAVCLSNTDGVLFQTPTIDQYTLLIGKQKVIG